MRIEEFYHPARATITIKPKSTADFIKGHPWATKGIAEEKLDGARYLLYMDEEQSQLRSRNWGVNTNEPVDKTENVPHIAKGYPGYNGTVLDGEIQAGTNSSSTVSIMGCSPAKAIARQEENGWVKYNVFDILFFKGRDLRSEPWHVRDGFRQQVIQDLKNIHISYVPNMQIKDAVKHYNRIVGHGGEGLILKRTDSIYGQQWVKVKKLITVDVIISGYVEGGGKYTGQIGAIKFSLYKDGELVEVGQCSGMDDATRMMISNNRAGFDGRIIEVSGQEFTKDLRLRHPRFIKFRDDKTVEDCVWSEQLNIEGALIKL